MHELFAIISAVLAIVAGPSYVVDIIRGTTKPERATWVIFSSLGLIAFYSQFKLGANLSLVFSGIDLLGSLGILALSVKYGVGGFTRLDKIALVIASIGLAVSLLSGKPVLAIIGVIVADVAGGALTVRKAYLQPQSEPYTSWLLFATAAIFGALSIRQYSLGLLLYPVYVVLANYSVPLAKFLGHRRLATQ